jgi:hypothetical protein
MLLARVQGPGGGGPSQPFAYAAPAPADRRCRRGRSARASDPGHRYVAEALTGSC